MAYNNDKVLGLGLTYDDVLLVPNYSEVLPRDVDLSSRFSKNIGMKTPIVSAAMDTVTESAMAIAIAQEGGIGVIHKNMTIEQQAVEVRKVKRAESGMILDPVTLTKDATVREANAMMAEFRIGGIPVVNANRELIGIVTNRDLRFEKDSDRLINEVMTKENLITTKPNGSMDEAESMLQEHKIEKLPVVDEQNKLVGLITYRDITKIKIKPNANKDQFGRLRVAAAVGVTQDVVDRVTALNESGVDAVIIDTAHGHTKGVVEALQRVKAKFPNLDVVVGNIATPEAALYLMEAGADAVKVGIGPGSICTTRIVAGVGFPQLSAVMEIAKAIDNRIPIIADGGIRFTGDIVKALAAGADCVMLGSMFAGTKESPGETVIYEGRKYKTYRGMGSVEAMTDGSKDRYFQDVEDDVKKLVPEGIVGRVPYKGEVSEVMYQFIGGLRAGMGYCGSKNIPTLKESAGFIQITAAGMQESHPHNVSITREAPNYSRR
ncbi:MAG: IMP dehydrogenase [Schleiferiaceae bacterium]|jgi:IMP dehydrogenase|nr:IMP dehydrogenase [Schleiferiaceae bacterium]MDG1312652.1 IMP dehydrogenase [Schleiferiaceae bacterium]MDG1918729.1 IMP dehydrogenase [Schleiferiaceae bacterium]